MNLYELCEIIEAFRKDGDLEIVAFYERKKEELIKRISNDINSKLIES